MKKLIIFGLMFAILAYLASAAMTSVTLNAPANYSYTTASQNLINITAVGADAASFTCVVYSNDTGSWAAEGAAFNAVNNTVTTANRFFTEGVVVWNTVCYPPGNVTNSLSDDANNTLFVDYTVPSITVNSPADDGYSTTQSTNINATVTDTFADSCKLYKNDTYNVTVGGISSGISFLINMNVTADGDYSYILECNDSAGNIVNSTSRDVTIDTDYPGVTSVDNYTNTSSCVSWTWNYTMDEASNYTFEWGTASGTYTYSDSNSGYSTSQYPELTFNSSYETTYYANITVCDIAGNCNGSYTEQSQASPAPLCTGWNLYSIRDSVINLANLSADTGADYVYWWNASAQSWLYYASAATTYGATDLGNDDVVQLYTSADTTWWRNNTGTHTNLPIDLNVGHNYLPLHWDTDFGNLSHINFRNSSGGNLTPDNVDFQISFLSGWNNSAKEWIPHIYTWSINNATKLGYGHKNYLDVVWAYSDYNISVYWNETGYVYRNWTITP